jgi:hypothetical protein
LNFGGQAPQQKEPSDGYDTHEDHRHPLAENEKQKNIKINKNIKRTF